MLRIGMSFLPLFLRFPAPTCSAGCDEDLAAVNFDDCRPQINYSEICRLILGRKNTPTFTNWTVATEWLARISQNSMADNALRVLTVIGDKPAATPITKEISNNRTFVIGKDHVINYTIDDVSDQNYEFMRQLECGTDVTFWYETQGEKMFGGNSGITGRVVSNNVLGRGKDEIEVITGTITWREKFHPERTASPIFGSGNSTPITTFNTTVLFGSTATPAGANGVTAAAAEVDADQKFEYNSAPSISGGTTQTMDIEVNDVLELSVTYLSGRTGDAFRYTDKAGHVHNSTFGNGTKSL